jgi:hypothetical protein
VDDPGRGEVIGEVIMQLPDQQALWSGQVQQERADLDWFEDALAKVAPEGRGGTTARDRFAARLGEHRQRLAELVEGQVAAPNWPGLAEVRSAALSLKREVLGYIQGLLLQQYLLPAESTAAVARLLDDLTERSGIDRETLSAAGASQSLDPVTSVIKYPTTDATIWTLPVLVHEFGHHAAHSLLNADPAIRYLVRPVVSYLAAEALREQQEDAETLRHQQAAGACAECSVEQERADRSKERERVSNWLHELFADVFATYALGPAYPVSVIVLRASPDGVDGGTDTHPPWQRRVLTMLAVLHAMSEPDVGGDQAARFALFADNVVEPLWRGAGAVVPPDGADRERPARQAREMTRLLAEHALPRLRYPVEGPVEALVEQLSQGSESADTAPLPAGTAPAHVVDAAWQWRLRNWEAQEWRRAATSTRALRLCARAGK